MQARRGELMDALGDAGLIAEADGRPVGVVFWRIDDGTASAEITSLAVDPSAQGRGIGRGLLRGARAELGRVGVTRIWLVTTNENLAALALYQKEGYRLVALRAGAVDEARRALKPSIPEVASNGIPIRDELELELRIGD